MWLVGATITKKITSIDRMAPIHVVYEPIRSKTRPKVQLFTAISNTVRRLSGMFPNTLSEMCFTFVFIVG